MVAHVGKYAGFERVGDRGGELLLLSESKMDDMAWAHYRAEVRLYSWEYLVLALVECLDEGPEIFIHFQLQDGVVFGGVGERFAGDGVGFAVEGLLEVDAGVFDFAFFSVCACQVVIVERIGGI